jgi:hypothetical protein
MGASVHIFTHFWAVRALNPCRFQAADGDFILSPVRC